MSIEPFQMPYKPNKYVDILKGISDEPPTLYALMNSKINYNNPNPVSIENLPSAFKSYLFDFDYPLDTQYKSNFEETFLTHYMFRRIGFETYLSFKLHLKVKLQEIMPKYNKMLEGFSLLDFLGDKETHTRTITGQKAETSSSSLTGSASVSGTSNTINDNRFSDLPQSSVSNVQDGSYLTDYTYNTVGNMTSSTSSNTSSGSTTNNTSDSKSDSLVIDKVDSIKEYKLFLENANNIYELIFKECDCLFFGLI